MRGEGMLIAVSCAGCVICWFAKDVEGEVGVVEG